MGKIKKKWAKNGHKKKVPIFFFKENGQRKKNKGGQKMGHQIGKDGISLKSKMNVLTQSTEDNYETNFLKIGLLWLWVGGLGG